MENVNISSFVIKESRSGDSVPVINDVHLHSIYDPVKEAKSFVANHVDTIKDKNQILILGLGFGYHLVEIFNQMKAVHGDNFKICVLEPSVKTFEHYKNLKLNIFKRDARVSFQIAKDVSELYNTKDFVDFLIQRPGVIAQTASFNLYKSYFTAFLSFKVPKEISYLAKSITNQELGDYLTSFGEDKTFDQIIQSIQSSSIINKQDHILLALHEMTATRRQSEVSND